jgi:hypothetical protein
VLVPPYRKAFLLTGFGLVSGVLDMVTDGDWAGKGPEALDATERRKGTKGKQLLFYRV